MKHDNSSNTWAIIATTTSVVFIVASTVLSVMLYNAREKNKELQKLQNTTQKESVKDEYKINVPNTKNVDKKYTVTSQQLHEYVTKALNHCESAVTQKAQYLQQTIISALRDMRNKQSITIENNVKKTKDKQIKKTNHNTALNVQETQDNMNLEIEKIEQKIVKLIEDTIGDAVTLTAYKIHTMVTSQ